MSDAGESDNNKVKIEVTSVNLGCMKNEEDNHTKRYRNILEYENIFGEPSQQRKTEKGSDNLIGFLDNSVLMENAMIKLEGIKEEDDVSFNKFCDIKESFVEDENKVNIEATTVNLGCAKNEPNEEALDLEEDSRTKQYKIILEYEQIFGEPSHHRKIGEDYDNLIGFLDNDVIMENAMVKLEPIKEDDGSFNNIHCRKCKGIYNGYCLTCSTLLRILNNNFVFVNSELESNTTPTDILEIRETTSGKGVYLLRTLPINIIFGPFEGISGIESTVGYSWKIIDYKLRNIKSGNWMKNIVCAASVTLKNLDIFQTEGNLYFRTNREIIEGEELLIYYDKEELQQLDNSEECLYSPPKQEKLPKIFACTMCCLGFGSYKCLMEHKRKCCPMEFSRSMKDFILIECHYCKMWMEKWEHEEYHVTSCFERHHRMWSGYSEAVDRSDADIEEMKHDCTKDDERTYQRDICSRPKDRSDDLQFDTKDYQCFFGGNHEIRSNECVLAERLNNEQTQNIIEANSEGHFQNHLNKQRGDICMRKFGQKTQRMAHIRNKHTDDESTKDYKCSECSFQTNYKPNLQNHLNTHKGIKPFTCDICMMKFTQKGNLKVHIKSKHTDDGSTKDYKCLECSYQTNYKSNLQTYLNKHRVIKPFKCDICMMKFTQKGSLQMHIKNKHADDRSDKYYQCSECSYQTNYTTNIQRHLNRHKGIKPFSCDICLMKFTERTILKVHIKNQHTDNGSAKDYKCLECSYQTNYKISFQRHLNRHRGIKPFKCDICMAKFTERSQLKVHTKNKHTDDGNAKNYKLYKCLECSYQTNHKNCLQLHVDKHRGIKPFTCDICTKKFTRKYTLKVHIKNKHTTNASEIDNKYFKCLECSYQTHDKRNFQTHLNKHRGIKPFRCDICMMEFTLKSTLQTHIKKKHTDDGSAKDYKCSECSYETNYKGNFQTHLNKHRGIKPFQCDICMVKYTNKTNLNIHIKRKHANDANAKD